MSINWEDRESIFQAFSDLCDVIENTDSYREGYDATEELYALRDEYFDNVPDEIAYDTDFLMRLIQRSGRLYMLVPAERFFDKELLLSVLSVEGWWTYRDDGWSILHGPTDALKYMKFAFEYAKEPLCDKDFDLHEYAKETLYDKEFELQAIRLNPGVFEFVPDRLKRDEEVLDLALRLDWRNIHHIPRDVHIDRNIAVEAVRQDGWNIGYLPAEYDQDVELLYMAVKESPHAFRDASDTFRKDVDMTVKLVKEANVPLSEVDDSMWKSPRFVREMFSLFGVKVLDQVNWWLRGTFASNLDLAKEFVKINPSSFAYLPVTMQNHAEIQTIKKAAEAKLLKERAKKTDQEKELDDRWDAFLNDLLVLRTMDTVEFQMLFYDTFWYFKNRDDSSLLNVGGWHILSCLSAFRKMPMDFRPSGCKLNEFNAARCLCEDLLLEINEGMPGYYTEESFVILRDCVPYAGFSEISADMSCYESFRYAYDEVVGEFDNWFRGWRAQYYSLRYNME